MFESPVLISPPNSILDCDERNCATVKEFKVAVDSATTCSKSHDVKECELGVDKTIFVPSLPLACKDPPPLPDAQVLSISDCCEHSLCQSRSEETPRSARNIVEDENLDSRNRMSHFTTKLKFVASDCVLSTPPITPSVESRMLNKFNHSFTNTAATKDNSGSTPAVEWNQQSMDGAPDRHSIDQRNFCPTAEELNFFRSAMEQMRSSAEPKSKGAHRSGPSRNRKAVCNDKDGDPEVSVPGEPTCEVRPSRSSSSIPESLLIKEEDVLKRRFRLKGLQLILKEEMSAVNKKIDVRLKARSGFTRTKLLETLNGVTSLPNHVIEVLKVRSNGEGTIRASSAIFGQPVTLHLMVKVRQGVKLNEKLVVRFYKEDLDGVDGQTQVYLVQVNAGGKWRDDDDIKLLISDIFSPFSVKSRDISMRDDSSVYSVTNRNTFGPSIVIDIPRLLNALKESGYEEVKALSVTGGLSFELKDPRCKPQIQKTGTIYLPFCAEPRQARLAILKILLEHSDVISQVDADTKIHSKKRRSEITENLESAGSNAMKSYAVCASDFGAESGRLSSGVSSFLQSHVRGGVNLCCQDTCPSSDAVGLSAPSGLDLASCTGHLPSNHREVELPLHPVAEQAMGSPVQSEDADSVTCYQGKHVRDHQSKEVEALQGPSKRAKAGRPSNPRKQSKPGPQQTRTGSKGDLQLAEAAMQLPAIVDARPNFPYSKRQRVPKRDAGDMIGGIDVLLPRSRRASALHGSRSCAAESVSKDEVEGCVSVSLPYAGNKMDTLEADVMECVHKTWKKLEVQTPSIQNGFKEVTKDSVDVSDRPCFDGEKNGSGVVQTNRVETELHQATVNESEHSLHHTPGQISSVTPHKDILCANVNCITEASSLIASLDKLEGDLLVREEHNLSAENRSILPVNISSDRSVSSPTQPQGTVSSSALRISEPEGGVLMVPGVKESCYASSLFVNSRPPTIADGSQRLAVPGISSSSSAFCPVSAAGMPAHHSPTSFLPLQAADPSHMQCGQVATASSFGSALTISAAEGLRPAGSSNHRCPACGRELSTRSNLNKHLRSIHGTLLTERA